jgi:N-acetyl-gamma-glutamyl-phosphate reductase
MKTIGLVGARGHTGCELITLLAQRDDLALDFAVSRAMAGQAVTELAPQADPGLKFEALNPDQIAQRGCDVIILAMPNGEAKTYVDAIDEHAPDTIVVDLSADYRFNDQWVYGLPEIHGRDQIVGAKRISNPGCYATAGQMCTAPLRQSLVGAAHVFGVSGYSGAGTTPNRKNDADALLDNQMPYSLLGHMHEREMSHHLSHDVVFSPHVAAFFRGLTTTVQMRFGHPVSKEDLRDSFELAYQGEPLVQVIDGIPEIRDGAHNNGAVIGGWALSDDGLRAVMVCALDNLLKGAAVQALQNTALALGVDEFQGLA